MEENDRLVWKMRELDRILDMAAEHQCEIIRDDASEEQREQLLKAFKSDKRIEIISEIKSDYREELKADVQKEMNKRNSEEKIKQLKMVMFTGFILAFFVGLAVNQFTELIGHLKRTNLLEPIWPTACAAALFLFVCVLVYGVYFLKEAIKAYKTKDGCNE